MPCYRLFAGVLLMLAWPLPFALAQHVTLLSNGAVRVRNAGNVVVYGTLTVQGTFDTGAADTEVRFAGLEGALLSSMPLSFVHLTIDLSDPNGSVLLGTNVAVGGTLRVQQGNFDLQDNIVDLGTAGTLEEQPGHTVTGQDGYIEARRTINSSASNIAGLGLSIAPSTSMGSTLIRRGHRIQTDPGSGNESIARYYDVEPTTNINLDAKLGIRYDESELNGLDESTLRFFRSQDEGVTWTTEGGSVNPSINTATLAGVSSFSRWTLASSDTPLPVELTAFDALVDGSAVQLDWQTTSETNNAGFEVQQRSAAATEWMVLAFIDGHGTTTETQSYTHRIESLEPGRYVFRLKQLDYDGTFDYSPEVEVAVAVPGVYLLTEAYPNPFNPQTAFSLSVARQQHVRLSVYNALGKLVRLLYDDELAAGQARSFVFEAESLPSGLYVIRAAGEHFVATRRVLLVK